MTARLFNLLLCALLLGLSGPAVKAVTRPENRVGGSLAFSSDCASQESAKVIGTRDESPACGYDFASGVHKYLYGEDDPVDYSDPSGHDILGAVSLAMSLSGMLDSLPNITTIQGALSPIALKVSPSVEVYSHSAQGSRYKHTYLKLTVASPTDLPNQKMQKGPHGENFFTISGEEHTGWSQQYLVGKLNVPDDVRAILNKSARDRGRVTRRHSTMLRLISDLLFSFNNYKGNLRYNAFPSMGGKTGYNSNSFAHGIINSVGAQGPDLSGSGFFPGWDVPVPRAAFVK